VRKVQVAVIGHGTAGMNASRTAAGFGAHVEQYDEQLLVDVRAKSKPIAIPAVGPWHPSVDVYRGVVWGLFEDNILGVVRDDESFQVQADQVILATGATDLPCPFRGGSLPGVYTSRALWIMLSKWGVMPGKRFAIVGGGFDEEAAESIESSGGKIVARVPASEAHTLVALGDHGVEAVEINGVRIEADVIVIEVGRQPDVELALMAECAVSYCEELGGFVPVRDENLRTSKASILVAGDIAGICNEVVAAAEGRFAGVSAAHALGLVDDATLEHERAEYIAETGDRTKLANQLTASYVQV